MHNPAAVLENDTNSYGILPYTGITQKNVEFAVLADHRIKLK